MNVWLGCEYPDADALALIGYTGKIGPSGKRPGSRRRPFSMSRLLCGVGPD